MIWALPRKIAPAYFFVAIVNMIEFNQVQAELAGGQALSIPQLKIDNQEYWAILGTNGSGKSALASLFSGGLKPIDGNLADLEALSVNVVSFEEQQALIDRERERDDSDILDIVTEGTLVIELLREVSQDESAIQIWVQKFRLEHVLHKGFRKLSTGETRKVILIRALLADADFIVFDEPFDGLDLHSQQTLREALEGLKSNGKNFILILNRLDEVPHWVTHLGFLHQFKLLAQGLKSDVLDQTVVKTLLYFNERDFVLPEPDSCSPKLELSDQQPLVQLNNGRVAYSDRLIFEGLTWTIQPGEHWAVLGPNGCGKSTLLNLISGDHPQCYANDLTVFGIKRGSGESIWEIKQHLGQISAALQWEYRASTNVISTVLSGLFDSIGLYNAVEDRQKKIALDWLDQIHLRDKANAPLHQLSYGEQRLVLIARAMIKQPALLILDEPCQGLDEANRQLVLGFIEKLAQQDQTTLLYVTHHTADLLDCFNKKLECINVGDESTGSVWGIDNGE